MARWELKVVGAEWGTVPSVTIEAHHNGSAHRFAVSRWPAGWRILQLGLDIPDSVRRKAMKLVREVWPDSCFE